jgi:hypothetical protein
MKKLPCFLSALLISIAAQSQSCLPEGIVFTTQNQIDSFQVNYPGCTVIEGDVFIHNNSDIWNLNGLNVLTAINGNLDIRNNQLLTSLSGLNNLMHANGYLWIGSNHKLVNLNGLNSLKDVGWFLCITSNDSLVSFTGFDSLTHIDGDFYIVSNYSLINLTGLISLSSIGGFLSIRLNNYLENLTGMESLTNMGGELDISWNMSLTSLTGLDNIDPQSIVGVRIFQNISLSICAVQSICEYLSNPTGFVLIQINENGCKDPPQVAEACGITLPCLPYGWFYFRSQSDIDNFPSNYPGCTHLAGGITQIRGNDITNLDSLYVITSIGGSLEIRHNPMLTNLEGLRNVTSIGGDLWIFSNDSLLRLHGLDSIDAGSISNLTITSNPNLSECHVQSVCDYIFNPNGILVIGSNNPGCNDVQEVEAACTVGIKGDFQEENTIRIYPNPASGRIIIEITDTSSNNLVTIFNPGGQKVRQFQITETITILDILDLPAGVYFVRMTGDHSVHTSRLIKTTKH